MTDKEQQLIDELKDIKRRVSDPIRRDILQKTFLHDYLFNALLSDEAKKAIAPLLESQINTDESTLRFRRISR